MTESIEVSGHYHRHAEKLYTIVVRPADTKLFKEAGGNDWGDLHEGLFRWFVDHEGFTTDSLVIRPIDVDKPFAAEVEFIDEGIVMAKLQGYID